MTTITQLSVRLTTYTGHRHARLLGRGTTALFVAFRALAIVAGPGEIVLPDLICSTVLDAVLLAGHTPIFADVLPGRWTIDPVDARRKITGRTRAVLVAHLFGHVADVPRAAFANLGVPIIEDAIQGFGGNVGQIGDMTLIGFAASKMIGGRGGAILTDDSALWKIIRAIPITPPPIDPAAFGPNERLRAYRQQLQSAAPDLLYPFDDSAANITLIETGWQALAENVRIRNANAQYLIDHLADTGLQVAAIRPGDAVWRFTFAAPTVLCASWIARHLQRAGLPGSRLYPSLSAIFSPEQSPANAAVAPRLVNLWVDSVMDQATLDRVLAIVHRAPGVMG